jgi:uncharacterized protein YaaN involved in tellurite resistance
MPDDPLLVPQQEVNVADHSTAEAVLDSVVPALNEAIARIKKLHERVLQLENEVLAGNPRESADNPIIVLTPLSEVVDAGQLAALHDAGLETAKDVAEASDSMLRDVKRIGPTTLDKIRDTYPPID